MKKRWPLGCKRLTMLLLLGLAVGYTYAQSSRAQGVFWSKVRFGGGIGLGFGNESFTLQLAPSALYQANPFWGLGIGLNFNHAKFGEERFTAFGGSLITLFNPIPALQLSAELEAMRVHRDFGVPMPAGEENYWLPALYTGLGYSNGNVTIGIRYDLLYNESKSLYADPWMPFVRVYF